MATGIPATAEKLELQQMQRRVETFVSVDTDRSKGAGAGLALVPTTHPNDLYAGETAKFRILLDGKPAKNLAVEIIAGGTRYRDSPGEPEDGRGWRLQREVARGRDVLDRRVGRRRERDGAEGEEAPRFVQRHS